MNTHPLLSGIIEAPTTSELASIATIMREAAGVIIGPTKGAMVQSRLAKRLRALKLGNYRAYIALLNSIEGETEKRQMVSALTTNVTHFFRENHHFDQLRHSTLPPLIARAKAGGRVRLWSAGCSNGPEAYSIAMVMADLLPEIARYDVRILATDIDQAVVARARAATYDIATANGIPPCFRNRFTEPCETGVRIASDLRNLITFQELNLHAPWPIRGQFDVIFCRNVVIYFDHQAQNSLWRRFESLLAPGGWLFVGHSERVSIQQGSRLVTAGITSYRLAERDPLPEENVWR
ncbi:protein-glutamate O-methyltransferase [Phaeovulum sp.]|uniref:protein-glutamate O-methyltransferase n=1 Tax=Phaeovulum sp. TaxID=2934796 RepID=UPI0039E4B54F